MQKPPLFILDDDPRALAALIALTKAYNYPATAFASPEDFLAHLPQPQRGCLLVDLNGPWFDARTFILRLREQSKKLHVVLLMHHVDLADDADWLEWGVFAVVRKPYEPAAFFAAIDRAMAATD